MKDYSVGLVSYDQAREWILQRHYAKRMPSVSYVFGLFRNKILVGICTFGLPASQPEYAAWKPFRLLELNRLVIEDGNDRNSASFFISRTFRSLPIPTVLISYADHNQGHIGYVYQATNWIYTGNAKGSKMFLLNDGTVKHSRHIYKSLSDIKETYESSPKARYYYFLGTKKERKQMAAMLRFSILPYPKGESKKYDTSKPLVRKGLLY